MEIEMTGKSEDKGQSQAAHERNAARTRSRHLPDPQAVAQASGLPLEQVEQVYAAIEKLRAGEDGTEA